MRMILIMLCVLAVTSVPAQTFDPVARLEEAQDRAAAVKAARVDALRQLGEAIQGVRITAKTVVKDFVTESDEITAQFEGFLQGAHQEGKPKIYNDGVVEIKLVMYLDETITGLQEIQRNNKTSFSANDFENMRKYAGKKFEAVGTGAMKRQPSPPSNVDLWTYVSSQGRLMAKRAAQTDAYRNMGETLYGVKIDSKTDVEDFVCQGDKIKASFDGLVRGVQFEKEVYHPDGLVEVTAYIPIDTFIASLSQISQQHYRGQKFTSETFENIRKYFPEDVIIATGTGAPPVKYISNIPRYPSIAGEPTHTRIDEVYTPPTVATTTPTRPDGTTPTRPDGTTPTRPDGTTPTRPDGTTPTRPDGTTPAEPVVVVPTPPQISAPPTPPGFSLLPPKRPSLPPIPKVPERFIPEWAKRYISATGNGAYPADMHVGQAKAMARRAAQVDAYRLLYESAVGMRLQGETTVANFVAERDIVKTRIENGFVRGAQEVGSRDFEVERYFEVDMKLYLGDMWEIIDAEYNKVLMGQYGKALEGYQPDQASYSREFDVYHAELDKCKNTCQAYEGDLQKYYAQNKDKLAQDFPICREYQAKYQEYLIEVAKYKDKYQKYYEELAKYEAEMQNYLAEYKKYHDEYLRQYQAYANEADIALMPNPPIPPHLFFTSPTAGQMTLPKPPERFVPEWANRHITATGTGAYRKDLPEGQAMAMARRAAQVDAYRLLTESAIGVHLQSETSVKDFLADKDTLSARVQDCFLRGAQEAGFRDFPKKLYVEVDMKLYLGDMWEIIDAAYNKVLLEQYGKSIEEYQPDQVQYKNELELYQAQLKDYKDRYLEYQKQLSDYYIQYQNKLAMDQAVARKYRARYQEYSEQAKAYEAGCKQYEKDLQKYRAEKKRHQEEYEKNYAQYKQTLKAYQAQADAALMPAPPLPPELAFASPTMPGEIKLPKPPERFVPEWANREITATGTGAYRQDLPEGQARAMAKRAAQVDAYRLLVESAMGVHLQSETKVSDFLTERDTLAARVQDCFLRGAQEVAARDVPERRYFQVDMKLYLGDMWEIIDAEYNKVLMQQYGKKLEEYQPDQLRFRTEVEIYQAQLQEYKKQYLAYQEQIQAYYKQYGSTLSQDYPLCKKYQEQYKKAQSRSDEYKVQYEKYEESVRKYQAEAQRQQSEYEKLYGESQKQYQQYQREAEIALIPPPPALPRLTYTSPATEQTSIPAPPQRFVPEWADRYITATGTGAYPPNMPVGQASLMAKRAAEVDAYRILVENAMGVHLQSETSVKDFLTEKDKITAKVQDCFLRGAQVVNSRDIREKRYCEVDMKLYLGDMWQIIDAEYNKVLIQQYGKKLEEYQPDQARYRTEMEMYEAQLENFRNIYQAYREQLREYDTQYGKQIAQDYPLCKKYRAQYQEYLREVEKYVKQYEGHRRDLQKYQQEKQRQQVEYEQYQRQSKQMYETYSTEAEAAIR